MRVLILGGAGAIGSAITRRAAARGFEAHAVVRESTRLVRPGPSSPDSVHRCDISDAGAVTELVGRIRPDLIVQAAFPSGHARHDDERRELLLGMCGSVLGLMTALRKARFEGRLALLGSAMSYGSGEGPRRTDDPLRPETFRGAVKASESTLAAQMANEFGLSLTELRIFTGYGPFEQRERLLPQLLRAALTAERVRLTAQPFYRDWVHYDDIADACFAAADSARPKASIFNVCSGRLFSTHQVAAMVADLAGRDLVAVEPFDGDDQYGRAEAGLLPAESDGLAWQPRVTLEAGLRQCWEWARSREGSTYLLESGARPT